jgi:hypothetical protein
MDRAQRILRGEKESEPDELQTELPHYFIVINIDGVIAFTNSEQAEIIPILGLVYSVKRSAFSEEPEIVLETRYPFVIGFFHGKEKPDLGKFLEPLFEELKRLSPNNADPVQTAGREFTASLQCVVADTPMRTYLKKIKGHSGYWSCERCIQRGERRSTEGKKKTSIQFLDLNAPPRLDEDFLSYCADNDDCVDDHVAGVEDVSPFFDFGFPMVTGFIIDPMHTFTAGAFGRRLVGVASVKNEGKLKSSQLTEADNRIRLFKACRPSEFDRYLRSLTSCGNKYKHHELRDFKMYNLFPVFDGILQNNQLENIMLLQFSVLLLGGFDPSPVEETNIREAEDALKKYVQQLIDFGFPIRPTTHAIIHIPDDVRTYQCGMECNSAYVFENFQRFFRDQILSGNLPVEQLRNRMIERFKYLLPTAADGTIIDAVSLFKIEVARSELLHSKQKLIVDFSVSRGINPTKTILFPNFSITNKFPNNICLMRNGAVVVCVDFVDDREENNVINIVGFKFLRLEDAHTVPFVSSRFQIYLASKIASRISDYDSKCIAGKMYAMPHRLNTECKELPDILESDSVQKWYVSPIRHTLNNNE